MKDAQNKNSALILLKITALNKKKCKSTKNIEEEEEEEEKGKNICTTFTPPFNRLIGWFPHRLKSNYLDKWQSPLFETPEIDL